MWDAFVGILPYTVGLLVSPLPVVAVIVLLISTDGPGKAAVFEMTWLTVSATAVLVLGGLLGPVAPPAGAAPPLWESVVLIALGTFLLTLAAVILLLLHRQRRDTGTIQPPRWLAAVDQLSHRGVVGLATALILANPVNLSMLVAGGVGLARTDLSFAEIILPALAFVGIGSLSVLVPYVVACTATAHTRSRLRHTRQWLIQYNNLLTFWLTLAFGLAFLVKGVRQLV